MTKRSLLKGIQDWINSYKYESVPSAVGEMKLVRIVFSDDETYNWNGKEFQKVTEIK